MRWTAVVVALGIGAVAPAGALAAGGPLPPRQGASVGAAGSPLWYVASSAGVDTVVHSGTDAGGLRSSIRVSGRYGIPQADFAGSMTGLSADGRTLVLEQMRPIGPARTTRLLVLGTHPLAIRKAIVLRGFSTVDAISPTGRWLYLIHYVSSGLTRYEVLAYDMARGRLLSKPIVDPDDRGEAMTGFPMYRVIGPGGRWAYTLYGRPSGPPFVHALDTVGVRAVCVDLPSLGPNFGEAQLVLGPGAKTLRITINGTVRAVIDTRTFHVTTGQRAIRPTPSAPARHAPPRAHVAPSSDAASAPPWELPLAIAAIAALAFAAWRVRRGRREGPLSQ